MHVQCTNTVQIKSVIQKVKPRAQEITKGEKNFYAPRFKVINLQALCCNETRPFPFVHPSHNSFCLNNALQKKESQKLYQITGIVAVK